MAGRARLGRPVIRLVLMACQARVAALRHRSVAGRLVAARSRATAGVHLNGVGGSVRLIMTGDTVGGRGVVALVAAGAGTLHLHSQSLAVAVGTAHALVIIVIEPHLAVDGPTSELHTDPGRYRRR